MKASEVVSKMAARTYMGAGISRLTEKPRATGVPRTDWEYLTDVAAGVQGETWYHIANSGVRTER